uniref:Variant surface glycoprotein 1125.5528 n=1 Tax=Trypanosoma brucei TaxID=5691 RepID=A0A1J0RCP4_9TRYP|nr:variant surface glycoprotein 1125.5528 [Trypanosoma brucei]
MFKTKVLFSRQQTRGVTAALLMALLLADGTTASSNEKVDAIQTPCDEGEWLEAVRKHYRQVEINLIARANDMSKEQRMLTLTAAKSAPGVKSILADVLAAVAGQRAAAVLGQLRQNQKTLGSTVALLAQRQGNIAALQRMRTIQKATFSESAAKSHSTNKYFATGTGECEARAALAAQPTASCTITNASKGKLSAAAADLDKITKLKMTPTADFGFTDLKVEVEHKGTSAGSNAQQNGKAGFCDNAAAASVNNCVALTSAVLHKQALQLADLKLLNGETLWPQTKTATTS